MANAPAPGFQEHTMDDQDIKLVTNLFGDPLHSVVKEIYRTSVAMGLNPYNVQHNVVRDYNFHTYKGYYIQKIYSTVEFAFEIPGRHPAYLHLVEEDPFLKMELTRSIAGDDDTAEYDLATLNDMLDEIMAHRAGITLNPVQSGLNAAMALLEQCSICGDTKEGCVDSYGGKKVCPDCV